MIINFAPHSLYLRLKFLVFACNSVSLHDMRSLAETPWIQELERTRHGCFFYTTEEEFVFISRDYIKEGIQNIKERILWVLPPHYSIRMGMELLEEKFGSEVESWIRMKRLLILTWATWFGQTLEPRKVTQRSIKYTREAYQSGFEGLRILTHAPSKYSENWNNFLEYQTSLKHYSELPPYLSFTAYSLIDCPVSAIASIAIDHPLCLIHYGTEWEWLRTDSRTPLTFSPQLDSTQC